MHAVDDSCREECAGTTRKTPDTAPVWAGSTAPAQWGSRSPLALGHPIASNPPVLPHFSAVAPFSHSCAMDPLRPRQPPAAVGATAEAVNLQAVTGLPTVEFHDVIGSTMDRARELAAMPSVSLPALVVAGRQHAGRGRRAAAWWQPPGSLAMTLVLAVDQLKAPLPIWSPACGLVVAESIAQLQSELMPQVRWPNDVELHGRKLAGVLVEVTTMGRLLIGIGINTHGSAADAPAAIADRLTTLADVSGQPLAHDRLLAVLIPALQMMIACTGEPAAVAELVERYRQRCSLTGQRVTLYDVLAEPVSGIGSVAGPLRVASLSGVCLGIEETGRLVIESAAGRLAIVAGSLTSADQVWTGSVSLTEAD